MVQILGLTSAIPFLTILINPEIVETNRYLSLIYNTLEFTSIHNFIIFFGAVFLTLVIIGNFLIAISTFMQVYVSQSITKNIQYKLTNFYLRQDYNELINQTSSQKRANITVSDSLDNRFSFL